MSGEKMLPALRAGVVVALPDGERLTLATEDEEGLWTFVERPCGSAMSLDYAIRERGWRLVDEPRAATAIEKPAAAKRIRVSEFVFEGCTFKAGFLSLFEKMTSGDAVVLPAGATVSVLAPSPAAAFEAWAREGAADRPPPGKRPWGARWER